MNKAERDRVRELIGLWMTYQDKQAALYEISASGPTQEQKMIEFHGDFPQMSNVKPEILVGKVDKMARFYITDDESRANTLLSIFPDKFRRILTGYEQKKNKHNSYTGKPYTHEDIAFGLRLKIERYKVIKEHLEKVLLVADEMQDIGCLKIKMHNMMCSGVA